MEDFKKTSVKILSQGKPVIRDAIIYKESGDISIICLELESKYCYYDYLDYNGDVEQKGSVGIGIVAGERSLYLNEEAESDYTEVSFPDFAGCDIMGILNDKSEIYITLVKKG